MNLTCERCDAAFEAAKFVGYCDECKAEFSKTRERVHARQRPAPGVIADGKFAEGDDGPRSVTDPVSQRQVCGLCGSADLEPGYGLGSGYGMGAYTFCENCHAFLDFCEDRE